MGYRRHQFKKKNKRNKSESKFKCRAGWKDRHHLLARSKGGAKSNENLLWLDRKRHEAFHLLFGNITFEEAAEVLLRCMKIKQEQEFPEYNLR